MLDSETALNELRPLLKAVFGMKSEPVVRDKLCDIYFPICQRALEDLELSSRRSPLELVSGTVSNNTIAAASVVSNLGFSRSKSVPLSIARLRLTIPLLLVCCSLRLNRQNGLKSSLEHCSSYFAENNLYSTDSVRALIENITSGIVCGDSRRISSEDCYNWMASLPSDLQTVLHESLIYYQEYKRVRKVEINWMYRFSLRQSNGEMPAVSNSNDILSWAWERLSNVRKASGLSTISVRSALSTCSCFCSIKKLPEDELSTLVLGTFIQAASEDSGSEKGAAFAISTSICDICDANRDGRVSLAACAACFAFLCSGDPVKNVVDALSAIFPGSICFFLVCYVI